jgi:hypothetical protein
MMKRFWVALAVLLLLLFSTTMPAAAGSTLYGAAFRDPSTADPLPSTLYTIDPATGTALTVVGPIGFDSVSGMAFAPHPQTGAATLYATGLRPSDGVAVLLTINLATGAGTEVGPLGLGTSYVSDLAYRSSNASLWGRAPFHGQFFTIPDRSTGAATELVIGFDPETVDAFDFSPDDRLFGTGFLPQGASPNALGCANVPLDNTPPSVSCFTLPLAYFPPVDFLPRYNAIKFQPETGILFGSLANRFSDDGHGCYDPITGLFVGCSYENYLATIDFIGAFVGGSLPNILGPTVPGLSALAWAPPNSPVGSNVVVTVGPVTLTFDDVVQAGDTTVVTGDAGPSLPPGFALGTPPMFYDITTTAVFSGSVLVCIDYTGTTFASPTPKLFHFESGAWSDVTVSLDTTNSTICGSVTTLSPFAIVQSVQPTVVGFAGLAVKAAIEGGEFELKAAFTLGAASNGINPLHEAVRLEVGAFSTIIPAGSFKSGEKGRVRFQGVINGVKLEVVIRSLGGGRFELEVEGARAHLAGTVYPVTVRLTIGDDGGSATVKGRIPGKDDEDRR